MSFINPDNSTTIYAKLTDKGRQLLAKGTLTYDFWVAGDSEIDYSFQTQGNYNILSPKDKNSNIKYPISSQLNGDIFNVLPTITPQEQTITNIAKTRGFFTGSTIISNRYKGSGTTTTNLIEGGTSVTIDVTNGIINNGDTILFKFLNPNQSGTTYVNPYLFYRVESTNGSGGTVNITVDRTLPDFDTGSTNCDIYLFPSGDTINTFYGSASTINYWNNNVFSFENNYNATTDDVPVWNFSIVYTENLAGVDTSIKEGIDGFDTKKYVGFKEYMNYTSNNTQQKSIGIIHYSNNSIANYYGEFFKTGTFKATLPSVMWHKTQPSGGTGTGYQMGVTLSASTDILTITTDPSLFGTQSIPFTIRYNQLVDTNGNVVGKVFIDLKLATIEDEELLMALSYKSNRNWSLPTLNGVFTSSVNDSSGLIGSNEEVYATYLLSNESGYGFSTGVHCQNYKKINRGGTSQNNIKLSFPVNQLPFIKTTYNSVGGITVDKFYILLQKVIIGQRPVSDGWKKIDMTSSIQSHVSGNIDPLNLEASSFTINLSQYNSGSTYNLNTYVTIPSTTETNKLQFGDESFFFGNVDVEIQATAYKSSFVFSAPAALFNNTVNPTFKSTFNTSLYFSEIGIYNSTKELVAIGKLSKPIEKKTANTVYIQLEIDF